MAARTEAQLRTLLNTRLRDGSNVTFTQAEKDEFLRAAINDAYVYIIDRDDSITTVGNQASYTMPSQFSEITDLQIDVNGDGYGTFIPRKAYDIINGTLYFEPTYKGIPAGKTLYVIGKRKLTENDLIPEFLQDYVLNLATIQAYETLKGSLTTRFLKNDMTMADIINSIRTHQQEAARLRQNLANQRLITL